MSLPDSKMTLAPDAPNIRKFAVYGRRSSGKTCILTALAMSRLGNPKGYSCIWVSDAANCPEIKDAESREPTDPFLARWGGKSMLVDQVARLKEGKLPEANDQKHPLRLLYQFTKSESNTPGDESWMDSSASYFTELVDYSGELVNPDSSSAFANTLMAHLEECDGLLVLAEATTTQEQHTKLHNDLELLKQVLPSIAERRKKKKSGPFPIAMLLNKWDRMVETDELIPLLKKASRPDLDSVQRSQTKKFIDQIVEESLDRFFELEPPVPQLTLARELEAVAGGEEFFRTFCVSALGRCSSQETETGISIEAPASLNPLMSFGLEDPFVWMCQLSDSVRLNRLKSSVEGLHPLRVDKLVTGSTKELWRESRDLKQLYPVRHHYRRNISDIESRLTTSTLIHSTISLVAVTALIALVCMIAITTNDGMKWRRLGPLVDADGTSSIGYGDTDQLNEAEAFSRHYAFGKWYRMFSYLFVYSRNDAEAYHQSIVQKLSVMDNERMAIKRISDLASGIGDCEDSNALQRLRNGLDGIVLPDGFVSAREELLKARSSIDKRTIEIINRSTYRASFENLQNALRGNDFSRAKSIIESSPEGDGKSLLMTHFRKNAPEIMHAKLKKDLTATTPDFANIKGSIDAFRTELRTSLPTTDLDIWCNKWSAAVEEHLDYHFYNRCFQDPTSVDRLTKYLERTEQRGVRTAVVKTQIQFLDWLRRPQDWSVEATTLRINYNSGTTNDPRITATLSNGSETLGVVDEGDVDVGESLKNLDGTIADVAPSTTVTLKVSFLVDYDGLFYESSRTALGEYVVSATLSDLASRGKFKPSIKGGNPDAKKNVVELRVSPQYPKDASHAPLPTPGSPPIFPSL